MYKKTKALNARSEALNGDFNVRIGDFYKTEQILNEPKTICIKVTTHLLKPHFLPFFL